MLLPYSTVLKCAALHDAVMARVGGIRSERQASTMREVKAAGSDDSELHSGMAAGPAALLAPGLLGLPLLRRIPKSRSFTPGDTPANGTGLGSDPSAVIDSIKVEGTPIREYLGRRGIRLYNDVGFGGPVQGPGFVPNKGLGRAVLESLIGGTESAKHPNGAIFLGFKRNTPAGTIRGITGHELGHALRFAAGKASPGMYTGSKALTMLLSTIGSLRAGTHGAPDGREMAGWTVASALASLPMVHEEIQASRLGSKLVGLKGLGRLRSFVGVPTYLAMAGSPGIAYGIRKAIDKIRGKKK